MSLECCYNYLFKCNQQWDQSRGGGQPSQFIIKQKQNVCYNLNHKENLANDDNCGRKNQQKNDCQNSGLIRQQQQKSVQSQFFNQNQNQQKLELKNYQKWTQKQNKNQQKIKFDSKSQKFSNQRVDFSLFRKNNFNIKFRLVYVIIILLFLLTRPSQSQTWTIYNATNQASRTDKIKLSQDQKIAVTVGQYGSLTIWSVAFPNLYKLQYFPEDSNCNIAIQNNQIFLWNNGQKIFVGTNNGIISTYQRNTDGLTWTKYSNATQIPGGTQITSLVLNKQGTKMYVTSYSYNYVTVFKWNGSSWMGDYSINYPDNIDVRMKFYYNVYLTKDQSQLWVHGFKGNIELSNGKTQFSYGLCFYNKNTLLFTYEFSYCIDNVDLVKSMLRGCYQYSMNVSPNQKYISWDGNSVDNIAVLNQNTKKFIYIKSKTYNDGFWTLNYINSNNQYFELIRYSQKMITLDRSNINYNAQNPSSTTFSLINSQIISFSYLLNAVFSKSSNFGLFSSSYPQNIIYSAGTICSSVSNCSLCKQTSKCDQCFAGYKLSSNLLCDSCSNGYYSVQNSLPLSCVACPVRCSTCQSSSNCTSCNKQYLLNNWNCSSCASGYYLDRNNYCLSCINNCTSCTGPTGCSKCIAGYYFASSSTCKQCTVSNCNTCSSTGTTCLSGGCATNYKLIGNNCCQMTATNCTSSSQSITCMSGYFLSTNNVCVQCPIGCLSCNSSSNCSQCIQSSGYILSNQLCILCTPNCVTCFSQNSCQTCKNNFRKINGKCLCLQGYYLEGSYCLFCQSRCKSCLNGRSCTACNDPFSTVASNCLTCGENYYIGNSQTCQYCDPKDHTLISIRTSNSLRKSCVLKQEIKQIPNCAQFQLINSIYQCKTCISGSIQKSNVMRGQQQKTECVLNSDIQRAKPQCTSFRASQNNHYCSDCTYPFSLRQIPNIENKVMFQCVQILSLEYEKNCRTQTGQSKPCSQCDASSKRVAKINMNTNKNSVSSFIKLITPKCTTQESSYCKTFDCTTQTALI